MSDRTTVAIFWDYENCSPPSSTSGLGYDIVNNIGRIARLFGSVTSFRAYLDISAQSPKSVLLRSELQSSGVSMIDCPHNGRKDVVDKMILVDMLAFAVDHPTPATIILITGDRDYAYAVSTLKLRKYQVILVVPSSPHTSPCLEGQASLVIDWGVAVLRTRSEPANPPQVVRRPYLGVDANLVAKLLRELQDSSLDDPDAVVHPYSNVSQSAQRQRRISTRDLLESPRQGKNIESFDSMQKCTLAPASPRNLTCTGSDPTFEGLPIPETPPRSRRASTSPGSTQARSTTIAAQSPPPERDVKNPTPSSARRSSSSDVTDVVGPAKRSPSVVLSLDTSELPLNDSGPPSSAVVRSLLEASQLMPVSGEPTTPFTQKLNHLASPFVMSKATIGSGTLHSSCTQQSPRAVGPTSPTMAETKTFPEVVTGVCETSQLKGVGAPEETKRLNGPHVEDNDTNSGRFVPHPLHSKEGSHNAADMPKSNCPAHTALRTTYSPTSRNVGVHPTDTPSNKHVAPPAAANPQRAGDINSRSAVPLRASNTPVPSSVPVLPFGALPSIPVPFTATQSHIHVDSGQRETWTEFKPLIHLLLVARERGIARPSRSTIAVDLVQSDKDVYRRAGVSRFRDYTALAERVGIIELGSREGEAWIALHPKWLDADGVTTTGILPSGVLSPASNPLNAIQDPILPSLKTPPVEKTAISQPPSFVSPKINSPENSNTLSMSPTVQRDGVSWASIPARFQPLIDFLVRMRVEGFHQILRSVIGQSLSQDVYERARVSGFKEYIHQASEAQLVQLGGIGGHAWIRLHPELRV